MAISNVGELKSELSAYLFHPRLANRYDNCIKLFETAANSRLRVLPMEAGVVLTTVAGRVALPVGYLAWRSVEWRLGSPFVELDYVHPAYFLTTWPSRSNGPPKIFEIQNNTLSTRPIDDTTDAFALRYYEKIPTLSDAANATTNWLLTEYPNVYLFGVLTELAAVQRNAEMAQLYKARRDEAFAEITQRYALTTGATSLSVRTAEYY